VWPLRPRWKVPVQLVVRSGVNFPASVVDQIVVPPRQFEHAQWVFGTLVRSITGASVMTVSGGAEGGGPIAVGEGLVSGFRFGFTGGGNDGPIKNSSCSISVSASSSSSSGRNLMGGVASGGNRLVDGSNEGLFRSKPAMNSDRASFLLLKFPFESRVIPCTSAGWLLYWY
jgi:hypothetical protein